MIIKSFITHLNTLKKVQLKPLMLLLFLTTFIYACKTEDNNVKSQESSLSRLDSLLLSTKKEDKITLEKLLKKRFESNNESFAVSAINYYYTLHENNAEYDSLQKVLLNRFPKGTQARMLEVIGLYEGAPSAKVLENRFDTWMAKFPPSNYAANNRNIYNDHLYNIIQSYIKEKNIPAAEQCIAKLIKSPIIASSYLDISKAFYEASFFDKSRFYLDASFKNSTESLKDSSINEESKMVLQYLYLNQLFLNAELLVKENNPTEAVKYFKQYKDSTGLQNPNAIMKYAKVLFALGEKENAFAQVEDLVKANKATKDDHEFFKSLFLEIKGNEADFKVYQATLKKEAQQKLSEEIAKLIINEPAPNVGLKHMNGKSIALQDLKGKVLVLDFWANWCTPCKASFPAAKRIIESYKDDSDTKFLFINTFENGDRDKIIKKTKDFLSSNSYDFDMYIDTKSTTKRTDVVANAFNVKGIPVKFIIDKKGNIRFKVVGYGGNIEEEENKISAMIDIVKNLD
ncbi:redoxin domain-containing protein [Thalassobellus citreus]|uniref:redoxin domain-containing protein n=1 Tax=Thalassobellus citreus TaxID=3367752 RepID=UPI0037A390CE